MSQQDLIGQFRYNAAKTVEATDSLEVYDQSIEHQVSIAPGTATEGTVTVTATPVNMPNAETVYDIFGAALVVDLADGQRTFYVGKNRFTSFTYTIAGANGTVIISAAGLE